MLEKLWSTQCGKICYISAVDSVENKSGTKPNIKNEQNISSTLAEYLNFGTFLCYSLKNRKIKDFAETLNTQS